MLLIPFFSAAILARQLRWAELAALIAVFCVFAAKDPILVLARQRLIWKQPHPETQAARKWLLGYLAILISICGFSLYASPLLTRILACAIPIGFWTFIVGVNLKNRQRNTLIQIAGAFTLSATALVACMSVTGRVEPWCWKLWLLLALQATAGILVVHTRLDARIAWRKSAPVRNAPALLACIALFAAGIASALMLNWYIAAALLFAATGYSYDLYRQRNPESLQLPLKSIGLQALGLSIGYAVLLIGGLW